MATGKKTALRALRRSQADRVVQMFSELSADVTPMDRRECIQYFGFTKGTMSKYLNGQIFDIDKAIQVLEFLRSRIDSRELKLKAINHDRSGIINPEAGRPEALQGAAQDT